MKKILIVGNLLITTIFITTSYSQSNIKTWTETTVKDFSDNELNDLIITQNLDGEVQLLNPLIKIVEDYNNQSLKRLNSNLLLILRRK